MADENQPGTTVAGGPGAGQGDQAERNSKGRVGQLKSRFARAPVNVSLAFKEAMAAHGIRFRGEPIADGQLNRIHVEGDKPGSNNGWYVLHADGVPAGLGGTWKRPDERHGWCTKDASELTAKERRAFAERRDRAVALQAEETKQRHAAARKTAEQIWAGAESAVAHPYLEKKGVPSYGVRVAKNLLLIPLCDSTGQLHSLQTIDGAGEKRFLRGGAVKGNHHLIGVPQDVLLVCEGYATGATLHLATRYAVAIAFDAGNLAPVVTELCSQHPGVRIVVCADNDQWTDSNPGITKARAAAATVSGIVAVPQFSDTSSKPTDFNDLARLSGLEAVKTAIAAVVAGSSEADVPKPTRAELAQLIEAEDDVDVLLKEILPKIAESDLSYSEKHSLRKKLAKKAGVTIKSLEADERELLGTTYHEEESHLDFARRVIEHVGAENLLFALGFFWLWDVRGVWRRISDYEIKGAIIKVGGDKELTKSVVDSVLDLVKVETFRPDQTFDKDQTTINCANGELALVSGAWVLQPHCREHYRTTQIPVRYEPTATAPRFIQFLGEVFHGDRDIAEKTQLLLGMMGYTLLASCKFEKFAMLVGSGANGKSVLLAVLVALLGSANVSAVQPNQFENRFQRAHLHGKLANIVTEVAEGATFQDAELKSIVSGELITAEHKHKPPFDLRPFATCWFGTNHMPQTRDFSDALFRRAMIFSFNNKFEGAACDVNLKDKLITELPGILNLALNAIARVMESGGFRECASLLEAKNQWRKDNDQVAQFIEERAVLNAEAIVASQRLYQGYQEWAQSSGIRNQLTQNSLVRRLAGFDVARHKGAGGQRYLRGIELATAFSV